MTTLRRALANNWWMLAVAVVVLYPTYPMWDLDRRFYIDWDNNIWFMQYYAEYLRHHFWFPEVLNTDVIVGLPMPVFYGVLCYPLLALLALVVKVQHGLRLAVVGLLTLEFLSFYWLFAAVTKRRMLAVICATLCYWNIYTFTNLYSRSAMTEFFAAGLFQCAACWVCLMCVEPGRHLYSSLPFWTGFATVLLAGTHPITAVYGTAFLGILALVVLPKGSDRKTALRWMTVHGILLVLAMSPWLYAYAKIGRELAISSWPDATWPEGVTVMWPRELHNLRARLSILPHDLRIIGLRDEELIHVSTPFLDTQINMTLLLFIGALMVVGGWRGRLTGVLRPLKSVGARLFWLGVIIGAIALVCSVSQWPWDQLPRSFMSSIQFGYRLITYVNAAAVLIALGILLVLGRDEVGVTSRTLVVAGLILGCVAGVAVARKVSPDRFAHNVGQLPPWGRDQHSAPAHVLPPTFYAKRDYTTPGRVRQIGTTDPLVAQLGVEPFTFRVGQGRELGHTGEVSFRFDRKRLAQFTALVFPWNHLVVNGQERRFEDVYSLYDYQTLLLEPGDYRVRYAWRPDRAWRILRSVSFVTFFGWLAVSCVGSRVLVRTRARQREPG